MPTGIQMIKLLKAIANRNPANINQTADEIYNYETGKGNSEIAKQVKSLCTQLSGVSNKTMTPLPVNSDTRRDLLQRRTSQVGLRDVVLSDMNKEKLDRFFMEYYHREKFHIRGIRACSRLLFCGHSGCGKTTLAHAIAAELGYDVLYADISSAVNSYLGKTSENIQKIFEAAKQQPCVLVLDEFDAFARNRASQDLGEMKRVVNSILQMLDAFDSDTVVIAATNLEKAIDPALFRRFDEIIYFSQPDEAAIAKTIQLKMQDVPFDLEVLGSLESLEGFTYADIEQICHMCLKHVIIKEEQHVTAAVFKKAIESQKARALDRLPERV